jgi:hypothetical protein
MAMQVDDFRPSRQDLRTRPLARFSFTPSPPDANTRQCYEMPRNCTLTFAAALQ